MLQVTGDPRRLKEAPSTMRLIRLLVLSFATLMAAPLVHAADVGLVPMAAYLNSGASHTMVQVVNQGADEVMLQAEAIVWRRDGGVDKDGPLAGDLVASPAVFTLAPGRTQIVRLSLRRSVEADRETAYRLVLRELPATGASPSPRANSQAPAALTLRVPVYVAPAAVRREQRWQARIDGDGQLVAQVVNTGNVHYKVGALRVLGDTEPATVVAHGSQAVLFPGEARSFRLRAPTLAANKPLSLEVRTEFGMQHVAPELLPN